MDSKSKESYSICNQLNLDIVKLDIEVLMNNTTYRRLYNIVKNDMSRSELSFRKNLIKELYFLLQIAPVIKPQLIEHFLAEVQKWYNLNDHKKIDLASNKLNTLLNKVHNKKQSNCYNERPKTGVTWDQNVSPFLRPYTAKRPSKIKQIKSSRPESSKIGTQSTKVETIDDKDIYIRQFTTNIQEELEISQDFIQKHRTSHPDYEPIYQQLYNILKKIETQSEVDPVYKIPKQKSKKFIRCAKSAIPNNKVIKRQVEVRVSEKQIADMQDFEDNQMQNKQKLQKNSDDLSNSSSQQQYLYVNEKKQYKAFSKNFKIEEEEVEEDKTARNDTLDKYSHCINNKLIQAVRQDRQMATKYVEYARLKSSLKKQLNRKSESRRLMSANLSNSKNVKYINSQPAQNKQNQEEQKVPTYDFTQYNHASFETTNRFPTYNKNSILSNLYKQPIRKFNRINNVEEIDKKIKENVKRPMTAFVRFQSPEKFDPLSNDNVKKYNQEALDQIEKIKMKVGGKCYASTESLMKALYIDTDKDLALPLPRWESKNPYYGMVSMGKEKKKLKKGRKLKIQQNSTSKLK